METARDIANDTAPHPPFELFYVYAQPDDALRQKLDDQLSPMKREGLIAPWHQRLIGAGKPRQQEIATHLEGADIILLLVSPDFLASDECYDEQMQRAMEHHVAGTARVIPILLRPSDWQNTPFGVLEPLPADTRPVTEWPNLDSAFLDIVRGLRKVIADIRNSDNGSAPSPAPGAGAINRARKSPAQSSSTRIWMVPFPRNPLFTGRAEVLQRLHDALMADKTAALTQPTTQAISGLGGIGKTQTALEYAYRHRSAYQYVFWVRSETEQELASDYSTIARLLHLRESRQPDQKLQVAAVKSWLQTHTNWLLILDNADDLQLAHAFLPPDIPGHVILTTRASAPGRLAHKIDIERMEPAEGTLFLLRRARFIAEHAPVDAATPAQQTQARAIVQELDGLPLALEQAGAYIEETGCGLDGYLRDYKTQRAALLKHRGSTPHPDYRETVATTWKLSFQKVEAANPAAADLLRLCAFLSPDSIPEEIITEGAPHLGPTLKALSDSYQLNAALAELLKYSLIKRDPTTHILSLHRLVQAVLLDTLPPRTHRTWATRATHAVNAAFPKKVEYATWPQCQRLLPSAQACADLIEQYKLAFREASLLLDGAALYLEDQGQYTQALPLSRRALEIDEQVLSPEDSDASASLNNLAHLYHQQGQYAQAEPLYQRSLAICEKTLGSNHPDTARTLGNLAQLYQAQGNYEQAEQYYQRALDIKERMLGPEHPDTGITLANLANLYRFQGKYEQAEPLYLRDLAISVKLPGPDHPETAITLDNLAQLYDDQGNYEQAEQYYQQALDIQERALGPEHPYTAITLLNLGTLYQQQGRYEEAEALYQRALAIKEKVFGPEHYNAVNCLGWYASLLRETGRGEEARVMEERARGIRERWKG